MLRKRLGVINLATERMEMVVEEAALEQERMMHHGRGTQSTPLGTPDQVARKARDQDESSDAAATAPGALRPNRIMIRPQFKNQTAPTRNRLTTATRNPLVTEKANTTANVQIKALTDLFMVTVES